MLGRAKGFRPMRGVMGLDWKRVSMRAWAGGSAGAGGAGGASVVLGRAKGRRPARGAMGALGARVSARAEGGGGRGAGWGARAGGAAGAGGGSARKGAPAWACLGREAASGSENWNRASTRPSSVRSTAVSPAGGRKNSQRRGPGSAKRRSRMDLPSRTRSVPSPTSPSITARGPMGCQVQAMVTGNEGAEAGGDGGGGFRPQAVSTSSRARAWRSLNGLPRRGTGPSSCSSRGPSPSRASALPPAGGGRRSRPAAPPWDCGRPGPAGR